MSINACLSAVMSRASEGLDAPLVRVEVHLSTGIPTFVIVGLREAAVRESRERVRAALVTSGFEFPPGRVTVNLSPADLPKEGGRFDLPIAIGILAASGLVPTAALAAREFYGELSLSGELRETAKLLPALIAGVRAANELIVPAANSQEAAALGSASIKIATRLRDVYESLHGGAPLRTVAAENPSACVGLPDIAEVRGQLAGKRALEIAAAGSHGVLMIGPPGAGKTMLAQRLPGLLPPPTAAEALEIASLLSAAGLRPLPRGARPFRQPQHTASVASLIGGSARQRPGELSLAHHGVLFLDELPEFDRDALEVLREPLESGVVLLSRAKRMIEFPARFQLVAAMNPCPCGYRGHPRRACRCTGEQVARYRGKISGPLVDRIDVHLELAALNAEDLFDAGASAEAVHRVGESSGDVAKRVAAARERQIRRQGKLNSRLKSQEIDLVCPLDRGLRRLLARAIGQLGLSARAYHHVLKLARSCADLTGAKAIEEIHITEALSLRAFDRAQSA